MNYDWLAGLIDGEGSFNIRAGKHACCLMAVQLRADDRDILERIMAETGIGRLEVVDAPSTRARNIRPSVRWVVSKKADAQQLVKLLEKHPLQTKKARDFDIWKEAVDIHRQARYGRGPDPRLAVLKTQLQEGRLYL